MGRKLKVYLPRWMRSMVLGLLTIMWVFVTYSAFFSTQGQRVGFAAWALVTALLVVVGGMIWMMSSGKLPAYIIEEEDDGK